MQQWGSWEWGNNRMQKKCLIFHKQRNHRMHTTNNVPQSRCRAFLIYGELSEMGRWSKRRWRHAEGLHFSLFSPHKQEKAVSVCHNTHTQTHSHTHTAQRRKHTHKCRHVQPPPFTCTLHTAAIISTTDAWKHAHAYIPPCFFQTHSHSPLQPTAKLTWSHPPPTQAQIQLTKNYSTTNSPFTHFSTHTHTHRKGNHQGLTGPNWELPVMKFLMCFIVCSK